MRPVGVSETADDLARELIADVGRGPALGYMLGKVLGAGSWRRTGRAAQLFIAVLFARAD